MNKTSSMRTLCLFLTLIVSVASFERSATTYINSNDRIRLKLSAPPVLRGPPGSIINLHLLLINNGGASNFHVEQRSEDGFLGEIVDPDTFFLTKHMMQEISVLRMRVPDRVEGTVLRTTFFALRQKYQKKKRSPQHGGYHEYDPSIGQGNMDLASISIEFTVTYENEPREFYPPIGSLHYEAQSYDETCQSTVGERECQNEYWKLTVFMQDEEAGLVRPEILATSTNFGNEREDPVQYRMMNYAIGTTERQKVDIKVSCCMKSIGVKIVNTAGETIEMKADSKGYGDVESDSLWSDGVFIAFVVVAVLILFLLIGLIAICLHVRRVRYRAVSQNNR